VCTSLHFASLLRWLLRSHSSTTYTRSMRFPNAAVCLLVAIATGRVRGLSPSNIVSNKIAGARALGGTDLVVSEACLGTMTWGLQNTQDEAFEQMDYALNECGVNFMDAAERE